MSQIDAGDQVEDVASGRRGMCYAVRSNVGVSAIFPDAGPGLPEYTHTYSWAELAADPVPLVKVQG